MNHIANNRILNAMLLSPDLTISAVSNRQSELILLLNTINSRLSNAPDGTLRIAKRGNAHQYYHRTDSTDRTGTYIKRNLILILRIVWLRRNMIWKSSMKSNMNFMLLKLFLRTILLNRLSIYTILLMR